jgi:hypothetical protein
VVGKRGPKPDEVNRRTMISLRIKPVLLKQLEVAAKNRDDWTSLSQEIERRLVESFAIDQKIDEKFHGRRNFWFFKMIADGIAQGIEPGGPGTWWEDPFAYNEAVIFITTLLKLLRPKGRVKVPKHLRQTAADREGIAKKRVGIWALPYERGNVGELQAYLALMTHQLAAKGELLEGNPVAEAAYPALVAQLAKSGKDPTAYFAPKIRKQRKPK